MISEAWACPALRLGRAIAASPPGGAFSATTPGFPLYPSRSSKQKFNHRVYYWQFKNMKFQ
jgi:hypothetical protein